MLNVTCYSFSKSIRSKKETAFFHKCAENYLLTSFAIRQYGQCDFEKMTTLSLAIASLTNVDAIAILAGFG